MRLALVVGLSTVIDQVAGLGPPSPDRSVGIGGVSATGGAGTMTVSTVTGSGSPLGILLSVTKP